jgi:hypothetical protein
LPIQPDGGITLLRFHRFDQNEIRIEPIAGEPTLGLSPSLGEQLSRIIRLEQLSGFLDRRVLVDCFEGADPFCRRMRRCISYEGPLSESRGLVRFVFGGRSSAAGTLCVSPHNAS